VNKKLTTLERQIYIEQIVWWEGRINASHLCAYFGLSRQAASNEIKKYISANPNNLTYDASLKGHVPTELFQAVYDTSQFSNYLRYFQSQHNDCNINQQQFPFYEVEVPMRNVCPQFVRPILRAIRENQQIDIGYMSLSAPEYLDRIIQPHALIFDGLRWHVRAYCNKNQAYRDFSLSRFNGVAVFEGPATNTAAMDDIWHHQLTITIKPDPRLSPSQQRVIALDYQMEEGEKHIITTAALVNYLLKRLHLDSYQNQAEAQQIILTPESQKQIAPYLP